jgi:predicted metal-dependent phosphoesterase TrpH
MTATVARLRALGFDVSPDIVERKGGMIDRGDIVWELVRLGHVKDFASGYPEFFWTDKPGYILPYSSGGVEPLTLRRGVEAIHRASGVAVLAHPVGFYVTEMPREHVREAAEWGLDGLEVYHPRQTPEQSKYLWSLVKEFGLIATGGTDCHGRIKDQPRMGTLRVHRSILDGLKARRR